MRQCSGGKGASDQGPLPHVGHIAKSNMPPGIREVLGVGVAVVAGFQVVVFLCLVLALRGLSGLGVLQLLLACLPCLQAGHSAAV